MHYISQLFCLDPRSIMKKGHEFGKTHYFLFTSKNVEREPLPAAAVLTQGSPSKPRVYECKWGVTVQLIAVQQNTKPQ